MIHLICTSCRSDLEVDDAFAGGVCRCKYCGTIQTVPAAPGLGGPAVDPRETLLDGNGGPGGSPDDSLQDLEAVVSSSGLSRRASRPKAKAKRQPEADVKPTPSRRGLVIGLAAGAAVLAAGVGASVLLRDEPAPTTRVMGLDVPGDGPVVLVLDHGRRTVEFGRPLETAVKRAVFALRERPMQLVLALGDEPGAAFPDGPTRAELYGTSRIDALLETAPAATGDLAAAVTLAVDEAGDDGHVLLVTGKGDQLAAATVLELTRLATGAGVPLHTVAVGGDATDGKLARLAADTGGRSVSVDSRQLKSLR